MACISEHTLRFGAREARCGAPSTWQADHRGGSPSLPRRRFASRRRLIRSGAVSGRSSTSTTRLAKASDSPGGALGAAPGGVLRACGVASQGSTRSSVVTPRAEAISGSHPTGQSRSARIQFPIVRGETSRAFAKSPRVFPDWPSMARSWFPNETRLAADGRAMGPLGKILHRLSVLSATSCTVIPVGVQHVIHGGRPAPNVVDSEVRVRRQPSIRRRRRIVGRSAVLGSLYVCT